MRRSVSKLWDEKQSHGSYRLNLILAILENFLMTILSHSIKSTSSPINGAFDTVKSLMLEIFRCGLQFSLYTQLIRILSMACVGTLQLGLFYIFLTYSKACVSRYYKRAVPTVAVTDGSSTLETCHNASHEELPLWSPYPQCLYIAEPLVGSFRFDSIYPNFEHFYCPGLPK